MVKLLLSHDGVVLKEFPLNKERITIGRKPHNDIQIDNLAISGEHAQIVTILNDSFLEDLNSTNGTLVNGRQVKKHFLQNDDAIQLGKHTLKYVTGQDAATQKEFEHTLVLRTSSSVKQEEAQEAGGQFAAQAEALSGDDKAQLLAEQQPEAALQILTGPAAGKEIPLTKTLTRVGKSGTDVAVITHRAQGYFITHVEGEHFPLVNGEALGNRAHPLSDHDIIEIASVKMEFFLNG
jgi:FHA domain